MRIIQCKIWGGDIHLHDTLELILVAEVWYNKMGKQYFGKVCQTERLSHGTLL